MQRIVPPEALDGDEAMAIRNCSPRRGTLGCLIVLVSSAVPPCRRAEVVARMVRAVKRRYVKNDTDIAPESRTLAAVAGVGN